MKVVVVKWRDASVELGDVREGQLDKECIMVTVGGFIEQKDGYISLATDFYTKQTSFRYVTHIPEGMIIEKKIINVSLKK